MLSGETFGPRVFLFLLLVAGHASAQSPASSVWQELQAKRVALTAYHQEFEVNQVYVLPNDKQTRNRVEVVDGAGRLWRQVSGRGTAARIRLFDGQGHFDLADNEFDSASARRQDPDPLPMHTTSRRSISPS